FSELAHADKIKIDRLKKMNFFNMGIGYNCYFHRQK
ncbi:hypothetical protein MNBD_BACTEROID07-1598, partial [hydrothermal vent metagenome]